MDIKTFRRATPSSVGRSGKIGGLSEVGWASYRKTNRDCHAKVEKPSINFQIIKHQPDLLRLHIEEAIAIQKFNPALNRRRETLGTGFLP